LKFFTLVLFLAIVLGEFLWLQEEDPEDQLVEAVLEEKLLEEKLEEVAAVRQKEEPK